MTFDDKHSNERRLQVDPSCNRGFIFVNIFAVVAQVESLQSSLHTATGRANQLQRANELLELQLNSLKTAKVDAQRRLASASAAAADAKLSAEREEEMKRRLNEISELKQQVSSTFNALHVSIRRFRVVTRTQIFAIIYFSSCPSRELVISIVWN